MVLEVKIPLFVNNRDEDCELELSGISSGKNLYEIVDIFGDLLDSCPDPFEIASNKALIRKCDRIYRGFHPLDHQNGAEPMLYSTENCYYLAASPESQNKLMQKLLEWLTGA